MSQTDNISRWAFEAELREYDPRAPIKDVHGALHTPGLAEAYDSVNFAFDRGLGLSYWKDQIMSQFVITVPDDEDTSTEAGSSTDSDDLEDISDLDEDMKAAIRASLIEYQRLNGSHARAPRVSKTKSLQQPAIKADGKRSNNVYLYGMPQKHCKSDTPPGRQPKGSSCRNNRLNHSPPTSGRGKGSRSRPMSDTKNLTTHTPDQHPPSPSVPSAAHGDVIEGSM